MSTSGSTTEDIEECPADTNEAGKAAVCQGCPGRELCLSQGTQEDPDQKALDLRMNAIKHKILVLSGKGGVGKSSLACALATSLAKRGSRVGLMDVDVCGPSVPALMGVADDVINDSQWGWKPAVSPHNGVKIMSVGSLLQSNTQAVVWRGPRKTSLIRRMLKDTLWGRLDYLVIDTPPGTSDEHLSITRLLAATRPAGAVVVTTPQNLAKGVVSRQIRFCQKLNIPILGIVENMAEFVCPCCREVSNVFSGGGGQDLAERYNLRLLGRIPLDPHFAKLSDAGASVHTSESNSPLLMAINDICHAVIEAVNDSARGK